MSAEFSRLPSRGRLDSPPKAHADFVRRVGWPELL